MATELAVSAERITWTRRRTYRLAALSLFAVCVVLRLGLLNRSGLWADELFSLAMATGHSLEQPAGDAKPEELGDYVEAPQALPPSAYGRYLEHDCPPAGPWRVVRAVFLSDTSPPLYPLLLYLWTLAFGTSDASLRLCSVALALACFPILWSLARQVGGRAAALPTGVLFSVSPLCVYYSTEGRMYALLWFWTVCLMWLTMRLRRRGAGPGWLLLWVAVAAAGLLTHYFMAFIAAAACAWLLLHPGRLRRAYVGAAVVLAGLLVLPWYLRLPESMASWRVTAGWLNVRPEGFHPALAWLILVWSFFSVHGTAYAGVGWDVLLLLTLMTLAGLAFWRRSWSLFAPRRQLPWLCLPAACLGPVVFDFCLKTYVLSVPRYALAGMPAAFLLAGLCLGSLRPVARASLLAPLVLACLAGDYSLYLHESRHAEPTRRLGRLLADKAKASDVVVVHSIPSGVAGVARYMNRHGASAKHIGFASWVGQLRRRQQRTPEELERELERLAEGRARIILVKIHAVEEVPGAVPPEAWLREHATPVGEDELQSATVRYFVPRSGKVFGASASDKGTSR